ADGDQALEEGGPRGKLAAGRAILVPNGLQAEASDCAVVPATRVRACVDLSGLRGPHLAGVERTLPCRVAAERHGLRSKVVRVGVDAGEVRDDLYLLAEDLDEQSGFRPRVGVPCSAPVARRQAGVTLRTGGVRD